MESILASEEFLKGAEDLCKQFGSLFIVDEIQTGIGRTGKPFAFQHYGLKPDIVSVAKGLGNGFPIGAIIGKAHLKDVFGPGSHGYYIWWKSNCDCSSYCNNEYHF